MTRLPQSYLVCASQRSGSTLLVESLKATGVAGRPEEFFQYLPQTGLAPQPRQWFADVTDQSILSLLAPLVPGAPDARDATQWRAELLDAGRTPNGVWGGKLMWNQTPLLLERAAELPARSGMDLLAAIADVLGDVAFVWVRRPDVVPQAVSMWRAVQTQVWRDDPSGTEDDGAQKDRAQYHPGGIAHLAAILQGQDTSWQRWFTDEGVEPLEIEFPTLAKDPQGTVAGVLEWLGLDPKLAPPPPIRRQGNARSSEWVERYRADAAANGYPA